MAFLNQTAQAQAGADCVPGGTPAQTNACAVKAFQAADTDHSILYADVIRTLSAHERPALRREQNAWLHQRAVACKKAEAAHEGRADWTQRYHQCLIAKIAERKKALLQWLHKGPPEIAI